MPSLCAHSTSLGYYFSKIFLLSRDFDTFRGVSWNNFPAKGVSSITFQVRARCPVPHCSQTDEGTSEKEHYFKLNLWEKISFWRVMWDRGWIGCVALYILWPLLVEESQHQAGQGVCVCVCVCACTVRCESTTSGLANNVNYSANLAALMLCSHTVITKCECSQQTNPMRC